MYVQVDTNLLYQLEKIAISEGRSVTDLVSEVLYAYLEAHPSTPQAELLPEQPTNADHGAA